MAGYDVVVRGSEAILPATGRTACDIAIRDGRIAAVLAPGEPCPAATELSARSLVILPGAIDAHLHLGHGVPSFKIFMNNRGGEGARLGLPDIDDGFLFRLCEAAPPEDTHA